MERTASSKSQNYVLGFCGMSSLAWLESDQGGDRSENENRDSGRSNHVGPVGHVQALDAILSAIKCTEGCQAGVGHNLMYIFFKFTTVTLQEVDCKVVKVGSGILVINLLKKYKKDNCSQSNGIPGITPLHHTILTFLCVAGTY